MIHVNPLLTTTEAEASMQPAVDFVHARNGSVMIQEFPSYLSFFNTVVPSAQAVRPSLTPSLCPAYLSC